MAGCLKQPNAQKHSERAWFIVLTAGLRREAQQTTPGKQLLPCLPHKTLSNKDGTPLMIHGYSRHQRGWRVSLKLQVPHSLISHAF